MAPEVLEASNDFADAVLPEEREGYSDGAGCQANCFGARGAWLARSEGDGEAGAGSGAGPDVERARLRAQI
jgi:hypothetical protein